MEENLELVGSESHVFCYNLNRQFSTLRKIVLTSDIVLKSFEENIVSQTFEHLMTLNEKQFLEEVEQIKSKGVFDSPLNSELYKVVQEKIAKVSENVMDIQLKDYNFMSSVSNTKFTVTLRTESFSISKYYQEKGTILSAIRNLVESYVQLQVNAFRIPKLDSFQIEIYESEEIHKHIYLKKEGKSLILSSSFGFPYTEPINHNTGSEIYFSRNENFQLYTNSQERAYIRDHSKLIDTEIQTHDKILSDENLVLINNSTKDINDAVIEMYITKKGILRIVNLSVLDNTLIGDGSPDGFIINKSSKNYDKISILGLRDNLEEESTNPKYIVIRNFSEVKEILSNILILRTLDGLIFTDNFYHPLLDQIARKLDMDVVFYKKPLEKSIEVKMDLNSMTIGNPTMQPVSAANPFSSIIDDTNKEKDEYLERLKNIDLNTPTERPSQQQSSDIPGIENIAQQIISSPNSSINSSPSHNATTPTSAYSGEKKSAIGMLADAAMAGPQKEEPEQDQVPSRQEAQEVLSQMESQADLSNSSLVMNEVKSEEVNTIMTNDGFESAASDHVTDDIERRRLIEEELREHEMGIETEDSTTQTHNHDLMDMAHHREEQTHSQRTGELKLITNPGVDSNCYFADSSNVTQVTGGEIYFMTSNKDDLANPHLNYVLPVTLIGPDVSNHFFLINNMNDFFYMDTNKPYKYFINLSFIDVAVRENFLQKCLDVCEKCHVVVLKSDIDSIEPYLDRIEGVFVKDIANNEDLEKVRIRLGMGTTQAAQTEEGPTIKQQEPIPEETQDPEQSRPSSSPDGFGPFM